MSGVDYDMQRHTLTIAQAIQYFGVSERTIRRWIKTGKAVVTGMDADKNGVPPSDAVVRPPIAPQPL